MTLSSRSHSCRRATSQFPSLKCNSVISDRQIFHELLLLSSPVSLSISVSIDRSIIVSVFEMVLHKRSVNVKKPAPVPDQTWRRFMNERTLDRAYAPTIHGQIISLVKVKINQNSHRFRALCELLKSRLFDHSIDHRCSTIDKSCTDTSSVLE